MIEGDNLDTKRKISEGKPCPACKAGLFISIGMYARPETRTAYAPDRINMITRKGQGG
jgi:hypothetical protein